MFTIFKARQNWPNRPDSESQPDSLPSFVENEQGAGLKRVLLRITALILVVGTLLFYFESHTSRFQARLFSRYAGQLNYSLTAGPAEAVRYPEQGPFDKRLGYVALPDFLQQLNQQSWEVKSQASFSPALMEYTSHGLFPPYREKSQAGLDILDCRGDVMYRNRYPQRIYDDFESVPPLVASTLLFIENRNLLDTEHPLINPAVDWGRFSKAAVVRIGNTLGGDFASMGGSTLATQMEKYRHSAEGLTSSPRDKLLQMLSASVRAYQAGPETLSARKDLVLSYLNTVPLAAAPGQGEVHGVGDGLWVWFGADFIEANHLLNMNGAEGELLEKQAQTLRRILSLMIAHRRPSYYLMQGRADLENLTDSYLRLMANGGEIGAPLRDAALGQRTHYRDFTEARVVTPVDADKGVNVARLRLARMFNLSLYDLDRTDLTASSTLQGSLQRQVSAYLRGLSDPEFAKATGLVGPRLLSEGQAREVYYSFTLFERSATGNRVRVQTDNTGQPFDINEGSKLELGSTAKLRVLASYLELIATLHLTYAAEDEEVLRHTAKTSHDPITAWALEYLIQAEDKSLPPMLQAALDRRYSANPEEIFFTGGGVHTFRNFSSQDNHRFPTVRESLRESINLPFVRLLQDLVRHEINANQQDSRQLLGDPDDPRRHEYLARFADREGLIFLQRFWSAYQGKSSEEQLDIFLDRLRLNPVRLAAAHRYIFPYSDLRTFETFLAQRLPHDRISDERMEELFVRYAPGAFSLPDQAYIAEAHPLELWLLAYLQKHPQAEFAELSAASRERRQEVYGWLFRTRAKNAQDSRIRTMLEVEAFANLHQRWRRLGYPFDHLVPSLASALGSSGDRPAALAELMGIILNDGLRLPTFRLDQLHFAAETPYEVKLRHYRTTADRVMDPYVAAALRDALSDVVEAGTARRLQGGFVLPDGRMLALGGKTGTGDNRIFNISDNGRRSGGTALNRTATFVFYLGNNHFGTLTAYVPGKASSDFHFTSALPVQVLRGMAPILEPYLTPGDVTLCIDTVKPHQELAQAEVDMLPPL
ncbi:transglycosylase domain-containing protein [Hahella sp. HN01]|uniref:transglycosylase domain-containing protein n=1 Tax=Hahella sp. HN01 TaxID=2847262 RepID=UPI001C1EA6C0|nr:transglycosylase domain-containing protein [Hahella sp. HN01]MBU6950983.1 transglycosylase domain-containing protein [Hahella sp. HN01]